jgi:hypothetical protein
MEEKGEETISRDSTPSSVAADNTVRNYMCWTAGLIMGCSFRQLCKAPCFARAAIFIDVPPNNLNRTVFSWRKAGLQMMAVFSFTVSAALRAEWMKERWRCGRRHAYRRNPFQATNFIKHETTGTKNCSCLQLFVCILQFLLTGVRAVG